ncbi:MAG: prolipoprotein diacylglyceryl transferase, partial [Lachnospiraceae bacterium]|nr:prolipoprotein diacylglyceryl transferase [Lachnospiraceae bacterium]
MGANDIAFPNLGIYLRDVPKSFSVFGFNIAFYGLIIGIGVLAGLLMAVRMAKITGQNPDDYWDFAIYAVIFSIIGGRIYYVIFAWDYYKDDLLGIFRL